MFRYIALFKSLSPYLPFVFMFCVVSMLILMPDLAHASETGAGDLPFEKPLKQLTDSIKGPVAFSISLIGIVAAGAVLIFGGEMSGFLRTLVFLVLVIAIIVNASGLIGMMSSDGALVASRIDHSIHTLRTIG